MSLIFSESDKAFNVKNLDAKARQVYEASKAAVDPYVKKLLEGTEPRAKYKIEVIFPPKRKNNEAQACAVTLFKSGGQIHGGGDELLYVCRNEKNAKVGCGAPLKDPPLVGVVDGGLMTVYYCPTCNKHVNRELLSSTFLYKLPLRKIAENIYKFFRQLDSNADIYLKHMRIDIRDATLEAKDAIREAPRKMDYAIYTLKSILQDTSNDSQVLNKIEAFLKA